MKTAIAILIIIGLGMGIFEVFHFKKNETINNMKKHLTYSSFELIIAWLIIFLYSITCDL